MRWLPAVLFENPSASTNRQKSPKLTFCRSPGQEFARLHGPPVDASVYGHVLAQLGAEPSGSVTMRLARRASGSPGGFGAALTSAPRTSTLTAYGDTAPQARQTGAT